MKKILLFPFLFLLAGCPSDDEIIPSNAEIIGKWKHERIEYYENNILVETEIVEHISNCPSYVEFKNDNTFQSIYFFDNCEMDIEEQGTYSISNSLLSTSADGETYQYNVNILTNDELRISDSYNEEGIAIKEVSYFSKL